jgi:S-methylmethionine-dependent homocysteine/selenocysteine methylase
MTQSWLNKIQNDKIVLIDGGMGTELERRKVPMSDDAWSGAAMLEYSEVVRAAHEDYIRSGAEIIITNTFGTTRQMLEPAGYGADIETINRRAVEVAKEARDNVAETPVTIAGSISAMPPGFDRNAYQAPEVELESYRELVGILADGGVDLIALEMMQEDEHAPRAAQAAAETGLPVWLGISLKRDDNGNVVSHGTENLPLDTILDAMLPYDPTVINIMHTRLDAVSEAIATVRKRFQGPIGVYPESGYYQKPGWQFVDVITPDDLVTEFKTWVAEGARLVGGCCGTGPEHIRALKAAKSDLEALIN